MAGIDGPSVAVANGMWKSGFAQSYAMLEVVQGGLGFCAHAMTRGTALHENDRMVSIFPGNSGREPQHVMSLGASCHELEARGGKMMTLVDNQLSVTSDK